MNADRSGGGQVVFAAENKFSADAVTSLCRMHHHQTDRTPGAIDVLLRIIGPKSSVQEADWDTFGLSNDESVGVEIGLRKDNGFKDVGIESLRGSPAQLAIMPQPAQVRRVGISEMTVLDQGLLLRV